MRSKLLTDGPPRVHAVVLATGDEVRSSLLAFADEHDVDAASFTAIGAFRELRLAYFDWQRKEYVDVPVGGQVEVLTLAGDITRNGDDRMLHAHVVVGKPDGTAHGGHLKDAVVRPTLEIVVTETPAYLQRRPDPESGLALIDLEA